jgi:hypothetical protein
MSVEVEVFLQLQSFHLPDDEVMGRFRQCGEIHLRMFFLIGENFTTDDLSIAIFCSNLTYLPGRLL